MENHADGCGKLLARGPFVEGVDNEAAFSARPSTAAPRAASWRERIINAFHSPYYYYYYINTIDISM